MSKIITFIACILFALPGVAQEAGDLKIKLVDDKVLGSDKAAVTIIEYASLSCHHCAEFHTTILPTIKKEYIDTGKVRLIFRDFPLNAPALMGSLVSQCVGKGSGDETYFETLKAMFEKQDEWSSQPDFKERLLKLAYGTGKNAGVGSYERGIAACIEDKELETRILTSRQAASEKLKIDSTPSFLINGEKVEHMESVENVRKTLDALVSGKSLDEIAGEAIKTATAIRDTDMVLGKDNARVSIVEYANIACPHCGEFHKSLMEVLQKDYIDTGKVKFAFRELPMNQSSLYAFMLAHCKGKGQFYPMLDMLIKNVKQWGATPAFLSPLRELADKAGISKEAFYTCMENKDVEHRIMSNAKQAGEVLNIEHSPAVYIDGKLADGLESPDSIRQAVAAAVEKGK